MLYDDFATTMTATKLILLLITIYVYANLSGFLIIHPDLVFRSLSTCTIFPFCSGTFIFSCLLLLSATVL